MAAQFDPQTIQDMAAASQAGVDALADTHRAGSDATHIQNLGHRDGLHAAHQALQQMTPEQIQGIRDHL